MRGVGADAQPPLPLLALPQVARGRVRERSPCPCRQLQDPPGRGRHREVSVLARSRALFLQDLRFEPLHAEVGPRTGARSPRDGRRRSGYPPFRAHLRRFEGALVRDLAVAAARARRQKGVGRPAHDAGRLFPGETRAAAPLHRAARVTPLRVISDEQWPWRAVARWRAIGKLRVPYEEASLRRADRGVERTMRAVCFFVEGFMRTYARWLYLAPLVSAVPLAFAHCGGTSAAPPKGNDAGSNTISGSGSGGSSGSGNSSGSSSGGITSSGGDDGGVTPADGSASSSGGSADGSSGGGPPPCVSVDGGAQCSDPLMLPCGSSTCNTSTDYCCVQKADAGGTQTCVAPNGSCSPPAAMIGCKEAADCTGGAVCCGNFPMLGVQGTTSCMASCSTMQNVQICRTDDECGARSDAGALKKCVLQTCGSLTLQLCAVAAFGGPGGPPPDAGGAYASCTAK
jgi:hypothetical protein